MNMVPQSQLLLSKKGSNHKILLINIIKSTNKHSSILDVLGNQILTRGGLNMEGHYSIVLQTQGIKNTFKRIFWHYMRLECLRKRPCSNITKSEKMGVDDFYLIDILKERAQIVNMILPAVTNVMNVGQPTKHQNYPHPIQR